MDFLLKAQRIRSFFNGFFIKPIFLIDCILLKSTDNKNRVLTNWCDFYLKMDVNLSLLIL